MAQWNLEKIKQRSIDTAVVAGVGFLVVTIVDKIQSARHQNREAPFYEDHYREQIEARNQKTEQERIARQLSEQNPEDTSQETQ